MRLLRGSRRAAAIIVLAGLIGLPAIVLPAASAQATDPVLHGTLLDIGHLPVAAGGVVRAFDQGDHVVAGEATVAIDGTWSLDVPPGSYDIQGAVLGVGDPLLSQVDIATVLDDGEEGGPLSHDLVIEVPTVIGRLLDHDLVGVDGATIVLWDGGDNLASIHSWGEGGFFAADLPSGTYVGSADAAGQPRAPGTIITAPTITAEIVLPAPTLVGTLSAATGSTPRSHLRVWVQDLDMNNLAFGVTDIDGSFGFDLPDGSYRVWPEMARLSTTEASSLSDVVVVAGGAVTSVGGVPAAEVDLRLKTPNVMVEVLTPDLDPSPAGGVVSIDEIDFQSPVRVRRPDLTGSAFGLFLDDGDWVLNVEPPANDDGWVLGQVTVTVSGGEVTAVNGSPASTVAIHYVVPNVSGQVLDRLGAPAPGVRVATMDDRWSAITDVDGHFDIALPDGARQLTTLEPLDMNLGVVTVDVVVTDGELVSPTALELALPSADVVATVTDPITHLPIVGAYARLHPYGWWYHADTDADGHLDFVSSDGEWELEVGVYEPYATRVTWSVVGGVITDVVSTGPLEVTLTPVIS